MTWKTQYSYGSFVIFNGERRMVHKVVFVADKNNAPRIQYTLDNGALMDEGQGADPRLYSPEEMSIGVRNF